MVAVGAHRVVPAQIYGGNGADGGRFLPDVEVAEAADLLQAVHLRGLLLEPSDEEHLFQEVELELRAEALLFPDGHGRAPLSEMDDVFPAQHRQVPDRLFRNRLQHDQVARVVRELPERLQARAEDLEDLRTE